MVNGSAWHSAPARCARSFTAAVAALVPACRQHDVADAIARQPVHRLPHVEVAGIAGAGDDDDLALGLRQARGARHRPDRGPAGAARDEHETRRRLAVEGVPVGSVDRDLVAEADRVAERGRDHAALVALDVEHELGVVEAAVEIGGRAVVPRREAGEGRLHVLARQVGEGRVQPHHHLGDLEREPAHGGERARALRRHRNLVEQDLGVALDRRLAGADQVAIVAALGVDIPGHHPHQAGVALPGAAIVGDQHAGREPGVDESVAEAHPELLAVDREGALIAHDQSSFSNRGTQKGTDSEGYAPNGGSVHDDFHGRMWRVWRVWLWSKTETHMNTSLPGTKSTSYWLPVAMLRLSSRVQWPSFHLAPPKRSARSPS